MTRCKGLAGLLFGHNFEEMVDESAEYYEFDWKTEQIEKRDPRRHLHGPTRKSNRTHLYSVCTRCGMQVQKERASLFTPQEDK